ncbi:MAG: ECF-type sigma factor [Bryobacteraceae bacterium]|nr:ECF-type sigma factor [Bryobacteraceae bacterium]
MNPENSQQGDLTVLLRRCAQGDADAERAVFEATYTELKKLARAVFAGETKDRTLQPSVLLHEAFLRMPRAGEVDWQSRNHFFAIAARAMKRTLIDHARQKAAARRGGQLQRVDLDSTIDQISDNPELVIMIGDALDEFAKHDPKRAPVVELRFFGGLSVRETADVLGVDEKTVDRYWSTAKIWLHRYISEPQKQSATQES